MELNDKELLLLSSFMYLQDSVSEDEKYNTLGDIVNDYASGKKELSSKILSGGFETPNGIEKFKNILTDMQQCPNLMNLELEEVTDINYDKLIRGRCFGINDEDDKHVVAFRGTGGSLQAWKDNFKGLYMDETPAQKISREFVEGLDYNDITVTGHSKGGNLAMHITAQPTTSHQIDHCVSFDGQGFNLDYIANIPPEKLQESSSKIKSVSTYNDPVNHLLTPIAGDNLYFINNYSGGMANTHSSYSLYDSNKEMLEATDGIFHKDFAVEPDIKTYNTIKSICDASYKMPDCIQKQLADQIGTGVGFAVESSVFFTHAKEDMKKSINSIFPHHEKETNTLLSDNEFKKNTLTYLDKNTDTIYTQLPTSTDTKQQPSQSTNTTDSPMEKNETSTLYSLYNEISAKETDSLKIQYIPEKINENEKNEEALHLQILNNNNKAAYNIVMHNDRAELGLNTYTTVGYDKVAQSIPFYVRNSYPEETRQINNIVNDYREKTENIKLPANKFIINEKENEPNKSAAIDIDYQL